MKRTSLKSRILAYLRKTEGWHPKGKICDLARETTGMIGENTGRRLRELETAGQVQVEYRAGHAWYKAVEPKQIIEYQIEGRPPLQVKMF